jgi:hypothetical protein
MLCGNAEKELLINAKCPLSQQIRRVKMYVYTAGPILTFPCFYAIFCDIFIKLNNISITISILGVIETAVKIYVLIIIRVLCASLSGFCVLHYQGSVC